MSARSQKPSTCCSGESEKRSALYCSASWTAAASEPGACSVSASVNSSHSPLACGKALARALALPVQPAGSGLRASIRIACGGCADSGSGLPLPHLPTAGKYGPPTGFSPTCDIRHKPAGDFGGAVGGVIVDDDDLEGDALLREDRAETAADIGLLVARGDNDRDLQRLCPDAQHRHRTGTADPRVGRSWERGLHGVQFCIIEM